MLLILGSPIWLSLGIAAVAVVFSIFVVFWSTLISLWAGFGALIAGSLGGIAGGIILACTGFPSSGLALTAAGMVCAGLSIFMFYGCKLATRGLWTVQETLYYKIKKGAAK